MNGSVSSESDHNSAPVSPRSSSSSSTHSSVDSPPSPSHSQTNSSPNVVLTPNLTSNSATVYSQINMSVPSDLSNFSIVEPGITIVGNASSINLVTYTPATPVITENLTENIVILDDSTNPLLQEIRLYADQIKCSDFHGKGTIDDYAALFDAASKIAQDSKQVQLDVDVSGFNEFANAADELSALFASFTLRLKTVNIIDDTAFLTAVVNALKRIANLSDEFGKFKEAIIATNTIQLSESVHDTRTILENVKEEVDCAMNYIQHFIEPTGHLEGADLSDIDKNVIKRAVSTLDAWHSICDHGVSVTMSTNGDIQEITQLNGMFGQKAVVLRSSTSSLRNRYSSFYNY